MVSADQPLKKRKLHEAPAEPPPPGAPPRNHVTSPNLSDDEIQRRRRNQEEIRGVYEHYKQLKQCIAEKNPRSMPLLEESYLALITASRGCTSVQRILAEFIPRYALFCPTALEAATKVVVNMHNCSLAAINRGEDVDGVAYKTAALCISGLVDICQVAQAEAPTSSVIRGICSGVFINVLSFFVSTFDGIELFHIVDKDVLKMQDSTESYSEFSKKLSSEDKLGAVKLAKLRALSLLWIFFSYPKNTLEASFELFDSTASEEIHKCGLYFLRQVTSEIEAHDSRSDGVISAICSVNTRHNSKDVTDDGLVLHGNNISDGLPLVLTNCLLGMVVCKYPSLKSWIITRYKKFCTSASLQVASEITSLLEGVFQSFADQVKAAADEVDSIEDNSSPSNNISAQYLVPKISKRHDNNSEISGRDGSYVSNLSDKFSGQKLTDRRSSILPEAHMFSNIDTGGPRSIESDTSDTGEVTRPRSSTPRDVLSSQVPSPISRKSFDMKNNSFEGHVIWFSDGDSSAMDIFPASRRLWLGSLGPDASEALVRFQFEKFGPIEQFLYYPSKGFASVEYKSIMDAVRARKSMKGCSPWGTPLQVKFLDVGLGTRGAINGVAVGSCCHVYIGNVSTQWAKDEILHEVKKVLHNGPLMITDLPSEMALLMEFKSPEEATNAMAHLRQWRKDKSNYHLASNVGPANVRMHMETSRPGPTVPYFRSNYGNGVVDSPNSQAVLGNPAESYSHPAKHQGTSIHAIHDTTMSELTSQTISPEIHQNTRHPFHLNWTPYGCSNMPQVGPRVCSTYDTSMVVDSSPGGGHGGSGASQQMWMYNAPQIEIRPAPRNHSYIATATQGPPITPPQAIHAPPLMRPYFPLNNSWDSSGSSHPHPSLPVQVAVVPSVHHTPAVPPPFRPASVTPLTQIQGRSVQQYDQTFSRPAVPPPLTTLPPQPGMAPPLPPPPSSPPPLPLSLPPFVPPPPSSPPPLPPRESSSLESSGQSIPYHWQGTLSKSGVQYCTINAQRLHSDICKYSNAATEPAEWPAKLDMTKRTDFRHVRSTFSSTPAHKREVCQLLPSSTGDYKGFQDFISYLKQRECAGVIKIPAIKPMWARLLFILPYSSELSAMLSITPTLPQDCLIALVLPKETNFEWV